MAKANRYNKPKPRNKRNPTIEDYRARLRGAMAALAWHEAEIERIKTLMWHDIEAVGKAYPGQL
jgi:hypothetical protein